MTGSDLVEQAAAELYAGDPDAFMDRRRALAAAARDQGDAAAAKAIAALRKPTRGASTLNALARAEPGLVDKLVELGAHLRDAERRLDGPAMRDLSRRRRELVDDMTRRAFAATGQSAAPGAIREEVNATLLAAVADPDVAERLAAGQLVRAAQWDGFGAGTGFDGGFGTGAEPGGNGGTGRPGLSLVPSPPSPPSSSVSSAKTREPTGAQRAQRERVAAAEREVTAARRLVVKAETEAAKHQERLRSLEEQVAAVRHRLTEAGHDVREAKAELRRAEQRLERAGR